jgi:hypothetical protein
MSIGEGDVAALARQAVDLLDPSVEVRIEPGAPDDPYRRQVRSWAVWPLVDGHKSFGILLDSGMTGLGALAKLIDVLGEFASETERYWGEAFPHCPGHSHPASVAETAGSAVVLRCPVTRDIVGQLVPDVLP